MEKMEVDAPGKGPEPHRLSPATEPASIPTLDGWIEGLMNCKQLAEGDVQRLCDRVCETDSQDVTVAMTWEIDMGSHIGERSFTR